MSDENALCEAGKDLVSSIVADMEEQDLEPDSREWALLITAGELRDRMVSLQEMIERDGESTTSNSGVVRLHPAIAEVRQLSIALARVLSGVSLADNEKRKDPAKVRAAEARWAPKSIHYGP